MPFTGKLASALTVGAKTWRPKTADQQFVEAEQKRLTEEEQMKRHALQKKIETLENVRKLEAKTQALNEMAMAAEIRSQVHEVTMKERQLVEARRAELAKLELAKRLGRESLSEADLARIRRERMKAELLARAAGNHAVQESMRPIKAGIDLGPRRTSMPPPPPTLHALPPPPMHHAMPMPSRTPSAASHRSHQHMPMPMGPPMSHTHMPRPPIPMPVPPPPMPMPMPMADLHHRVPSEPSLHMRRLSGSLQPPSLGVGRGQWGSPNNALRGSNHVPHHGGATPAHFDRPSSTHHHDSRLRAANLRALKEESLVQLAIRAQAERLRRRRLQQLDSHARASNLRAQALRDLRKRELMMKLRERGIQQREIDSQVRLMVEHEQMMTEAQLKDVRDREHRLMLKEKGLQEREIQDQIRRREEKDREILRIELEKLERELRRKELLDAELAIKHAFERGESPPLGIKRPTIDEIENEGLLAEDFFDDFDSLDPRIRQEIMAATNLSADFHRGHGRSPSVGARTPLMRASSPGAHSHTSQMRDRIRDEQIRMSEENHIREGVLASLSRANTPRIRDEILSQMTPRLREETLENERRAGAGISPREEMLGDRLNNHSAGRPLSQSFDRRSPGIPSTPRQREEARAALLEEAEARDREDLRYREDQKQMNSVSSQHRRTPSMRDNLELHHDSARRHLDLPSRSASRASSRGGDYDAVPRSVSRSGSIRDGYSPAERLGLPSRPASRNLTAEDLGLTNLLGPNARTASRERQPVAAHLPNDDLLASRLHSAAVNSELNGGTRSRANSRAERVDDDLLRSARSQLTNDSSLGLGSLTGLTSIRSRANSRSEAPGDEVLRGMSRNSLGADLPNTGGRRSRANSVVGQSHQNAPSRSPRPSEFGEFGLQDEALRGRESRAPSRNAGHALSPGYSLMGESGGWNSLSNEELSQLSTEQLEMLLLSETGGYPDVSYDSMPAMTKEEISQLTPEQLDAFLAGQDGHGGMSGLSLSSGGAHRNLSRRPSRNDLGDSPPFGSIEQHGHGSSGTAHDLQRSRSRNDHDSYGERYGANTPQTRTSPHNPDSLYSMPGQYDTYGVAHDGGYGSYGQDDAEVGEFVVTEANTHPNTTIVERLGTVEADSFQGSSRSPGARRGPSGPDGSHIAVNNLIHEAGRLGANGIVRLRVADYPDGRYIASGEAVVLS